MQAVEVADWAAGPKLVSRPIPPPNPSATRVLVRAAGLHQVVRSMASGKHYASGPLPHTPGADGVGVTEDGKSVYFFSMGITGSFAEQVDVPSANVVPIPEGVDPLQAAGLVNPVMGSWMALTQRVDFLRNGNKRSGWSCLIIGATSMSGQMAIRAARALGATTIIGAARNEARLQKMGGLDGYVVLNRDPTEPTDFSSAATVDVALDFLYGPYLRMYLETTAKASKAAGAAAPPLTYVSIGSLAGEVADPPLPSQYLRSRDVTIRGAGPGSWNPRAMGKEIPHMLGVLKGVHMDEVKTVGLDQVEEAWGRKSEDRIVFLFGKK